MSYDLMVLDKHERFKSSDDFLKWYDEVTEWSDDIDYDDYRHATPNLQSWFLETKDTIRPINGEFAPSDEELNGDDIHVADYSIAKDCIYIVFDYADSELAYSLTKELAKKYGLAFFDISGFSELIYPDGFVLKIQQKYQEDIKTDYMKEFRQKMEEQSSRLTAQQPPKEAFEKERKRRNRIGNGIIILYGLSFICVSFILIQLGCFKSAMPYFGIVIIAALLILIHYIQEWEKEAS